MPAFHVAVTGQITKGTVFSSDNLTLKYEWHCGRSYWTTVSGQSEGISHCCIKSPDDSGESIATWSLPVNTVFSSSSLHGWPRLVVILYSKDWFDRDVVVGYGTILVPLKSGTSTIRCHLFKPMSSSALQAVSSWFFGSLPQFSDPLLPAKNDHRELVRTSHNGWVEVSVNVVVKGFLDTGVTL
ncbi:hypothetical protein RCL1_005358 [Eukaryota sp. TZLM3-RCL]